MKWIKIPRECMECLKLMLESLDNAAKAAVITPWSEIISKRLNMETVLYQRPTALPQRAGQQFFKRVMTVKT
eukprot:1136206-Ditylum_brightwellii.AAC.1